MPSPLFNNYGIFEDNLPGVAYPYQAKSNQCISNQGPNWQGHQVLNNLNTSNTSSRSHSDISCSYGITMHTQNSTSQNARNMACTTKAAVNGNLESRRCSDSAGGYGTSQGPTGESIPRQIQRNQHSSPSYLRRSGRDIEDSSEPHALWKER